MGNFTNRIRSIQFRYWSNDRLKEVISKLGNYNEIINVSGWKDSDKEGNTYKSYFKKGVSYKISNYEADSLKGLSTENDLSIDLSKTLPSELIEKFDIVLNHTVLEHIEKPEFAFDQMSKLTTDILITIIPWKQALHFHPGYFGDYFRISPFTMRKYYEKNGFKLVFEAFSPNYAPDIYLFYVGSRKPQNHSFDNEIIEINKLNGVVGESSIKNTLIGLYYRFLFVFYRIFFK